ncbi:MAG: NAD(P)-binding protein, partial [Bryobacteraceae bacterium]
MKLALARRNAMNTPTVDAVIVGAGAGGGIVARELATAGRSVVLLERGRWLKSFGHLETRDGWVTGIHDMPYGPDPSEVRTSRAGESEKAHVVKPRDGLYGTLPA